MEPSALRFEILKQIEQHENTGSSAYLDDTIIAEKLGVGKTDIQRQLTILENRGQVDLAKSFGPSFGARLTADGLEALEAS